MNCTLRSVGLRLGMIAVALAGCEQSPSPITQVAPQPGTTTAPSGMAAQPEDGISGTVVATMDASSYTYAQVDTGRAKVWVAGPATPLAVGTKLGHMDGQLMTNFRSDTLGRTFDQIYFVNKYAVTGGAPRVPAAAPAQPDGGAISGTVVETMSSGGYTYAYLDHGGTKIWVAGPETKLAVGAKLGNMAGSLMTGFRSDTLARTFDQIYFVNSYVMTEGGGPPNPHGAPPAADPGATVDKIAPVAGGTTIADVYANKAALAGKPVAVRGKVVKVNNGILDRNWLHLRDGTGAAGTNDLIITTAATAPAAKVGDIVVARGNVALDQKFGENYQYALLVENAKISAE